MAVRVGLVGLPNVGKSTLFNAVSKADAAVANFPFSTIQRNVGVVAVPDRRLERLRELAGSAKAEPATIELVDIAGLVAGASRGEGLGNQFLAHIRDVDAICHVVRCFEDPDVTHVSGRVDPIADIGIVDTELLLKDLETVDRGLERAARAARSEPSLRGEAALVERLHAHLAASAPARTFTIGPNERQAMDGLSLSLLTAKPVLYAANVAENELPDGGWLAAAVRKHAERDDAEVVVMSAELEAELAALPPEEQADYLAALGLERNALERLVAATHRLLGLVTFFTANPNEARAWTVPEATPARRAAGRVHSDMERGFIRADVIPFEDYDELGSEAAVRDAGRLRVEGGDYPVTDGDVLHFRFNV